MKEMTNFKEALKNHTNDKIELKEWGVSITPYLTVREAEAIVETMLLAETELEREQILVSSVLFCISDLFDEDNQAEFSFEDIVYSGFWQSVLNTSPHLVNMINLIKNTVKEKRSLEHTLINTVKALSGVFEKVSKVMEREDLIEMLTMVLDRTNFGGKEN